MFGYTVGTQFDTASGGIQQILALTDNSVLLTGQDTASHEELVARDDFESLISKEHLVVKLPNVTPIELTEYQQEFMVDKLKYMQVMYDVVQRGLPPTTESTYREVIRIVEQLHPETICQKHIAWKTLCRHWKNYISSDCDEQSLACKKRNGRTRLNVATEAFLKHHIAMAFSNSESTVVKNYYRHYAIEAKEQSYNNPEIKVVSNKTFKRYLNQLNEIDIKLKRKNITEKEANRLSYELRQSIKTHFAMQRVEVDRVCFSLSLIDDVTLLPTETVSLYLAIDVYTRAIVSVVLDFGAENQLGVLNSLRNIFTRSENLPFAGKPVSIVMDNGPGYNSAMTKRVAESLGANIIYCPSNSPQKKPFAERFNKTLRTNCLQGTVLTTASGEFTVGLNSYLGKRTGKDPASKNPPKKVADLFVSDFKRMLNAYLVEYHNTEHPSINKTPAQAWAESNANTPRDVVCYENVRECFHAELCKHTNKLQANGLVICKSQKFSSAELKSLYGKLKDFGSENNPDVRVYFDHHDARSVTVTATLPGATTPTKYIAYHIDEQARETPISFDELNGTKPVTMDIYHDEIVKIGNGNRLQIKEFFKQKNRKSPRRGPEIPSYENNNERHLDTEERIVQSHLITSKKNADVVTKSAELSEGVTPEDPQQYNEPLSERMTEYIDSDNSSDEEELW